MLKQREWNNFVQIRWWSRKNHLVTFFAASLLLSITTQNIEAQSPYIKNTSTKNTEIYWLTRLDSLVSGPYTQETKKEIAAKILMNHCINNFTLPSYSRTAYISNESIKKDIIKTKPWQDTHVDFCLFRKTFDLQRIDQKHLIVSRYENHWFNAIQAYQLHQALCYKINQPFKEEIKLPGTDFYNFLVQQKEYYNIAMKDIFHWYLWEAYLWLTELPNNINHWTPETKQFRQDPTKEQLNIGGKKVYRNAYDWQSAYELLTNNKISLRSTAHQNTENGSSCEHFRTCLEWISEETLLWIILLKERMNQIAWAEIELIINGWTEKWHRKELSVLAGFKKPWYVLTTQDDEAHWLGYSFDVRCSGESWIILKKIFPGPKGKTLLKNNAGETLIYKWRFHGSWTVYHGHFTCMKITTRNTIQWGK